MLGEFDYFAPQNLEKAVSYLAKYRGEIKILAGGTDLLNSMHKKSVSPQYLLSLKKMSSLNYIFFDKGEHVLRVGPMTTLSEIASSPFINQHFEILAQAANKVGSVQIRNRGTIGGNICNASPAADTVPALLVLQSKIKIAGPVGMRVIPLEQFFVGPGATLLKDDEILTEVEIPLPPEGSTAIYIKQGIRKAMDIAIVGIGVLLVFNANGKEICEDIRIGLGSVAPTPIRVSKAEGVLKGKLLYNSLIREAAEEAGNEINPISDIRATAEYRRELVIAVTEQAIQDLIKIRLLVLLR